MSCSNINLPKDRSTEFIFGVANCDNTTKIYDPKMKLDREQVLQENANQGLWLSCLIE